MFQRDPGASTASKQNELLGSLQTEKSDFTKQQHLAPARKLRGIQRRVFRALGSSVCSSGSCGGQKAPLP